MPVDILICGDTCPININLPYFVAGDADTLFNDLLGHIKGADLAVLNLECPLIEAETPIKKSGPVLGAPSAAIKAIDKAGFGLINLANNHILDQGQEGLRNTLMVCKRSGLETVGAGHNLAEAQKLFIKNIKGLRIAIMAVAEHEFSIAGENYGGANPLDIIDYVRNVKENESNYDYLIVLLHGGNEHYQYPSPRLMETCRFMVEQGANAVICQHSHCLGTYEEYGGGLIVYGQGNFIFDYPSKNKTWHEGIMVKLSVMPDLSATHEFIPYTQSQGQAGVRIMTSVIAKDLMKEFDERSKTLKNWKLINRKWLDFCDSKKHSYYSSIYGLNKLLRYMNRKGLITSLFYGKKRNMVVGNLIRCESHREVLTTLADEEKVRENGFGK